MINVQVKTREDQSYGFSVDDGITISEFKVVIEQRIDVPASIQRLIFCGRILMNDKLLKDYNVEGKCIHVVERTPSVTALNPDSSNNDDYQSSILDEDLNEAHRFHGSLVNEIDAIIDHAGLAPFRSGIHSPHTLRINTNFPIQSQSMSRITHARQMIEFAENMISYLDSTTRRPNIAEAQAYTAMLERSLNQITEEMEETLVSDENILRSSYDLGSIYTDHETPIDRRLSEDLAVNNFEMSMSDVYIEDVDESDVDESDLDESDQDESENENYGIEPNVNGVRVELPSEAAPPIFNRPLNPELNSTSYGRQQATAQDLAVAIDELRALQTRMDPYLVQYYDILESDPLFTNRNNLARQNAQTLFDCISSALHYMSHALYEISNLRVDLAIVGPRNVSGSQ